MVELIEAQKHLIFKKYLKIRLLNGTRTLINADKGLEMAGVTYKKTNGQ